MPETTPTVVPGLPGVGVAPAPIVPAVDPAAPAVPVAPVATPAVPPVVPPAVPPVVETPAAAPAVPVYEKTGNEFFDSAAAMLHEAGFDAKVIAQEVATNKTLTPATKAALEAKLGAAGVNLLVAGLQAEQAKAPENTAAYDAVVAAVGSAAEWDAIVAWTQQPDCGLTPEGEKEYNEMLAAGGIRATLAAKALKEAYMSSPGFKAVPNLETPTGVVNASPVQPISRSEYVTEKQKAINKNDGATVAALEARATFTMQNHPGQWNPALAPTIR